MGGPPGSRTGTRRDGWVGGRLYRHLWCVSIHRAGRV